MDHSAMAVCLIWGVSLSFVGPTDSAPTKAVPFTPKAGSMATNNTTTPIPPSQFVILRQKRIDLSTASMLFKAVAPVVVKPLIISK